MSLLAALALASTIQSCSWDNPGADKYTGDFATAVESYTDLAPEVRSALKSKINARQYDDVVEIKRDSIVGKDAKYEYGTSISKMHFGVNKRCEVVNRSAWKDDHQELGLLYCVGADCVLIPTVCRNVSRIVRTAVPDKQVEHEEPAAPVHSGTSSSGGTGDTDASPVEPAPTEHVDQHKHSFEERSRPPASFWTYTPPVYYPIPPLPPSQPNPPVPEIPEPGTYLLFAIGLMSLYLVKRRR